MRLVSPSGSVLEPSDMRYRNEVLAAITPGPSRAATDRMAHRVIEVPISTYANDGLSMRILRPKDFGNPNWQSNRAHPTDGSEIAGRTSQVRLTRTSALDALDYSHGPPEPVAQVRVLPGALCRRSRG